MGLGYGGGVNAFLTFAKNLGLDRISSRTTWTEFPTSYLGEGAGMATSTPASRRRTSVALLARAGAPVKDLVEEGLADVRFIKRMYREANPAPARFGELMTA